MEFKQSLAQRIIIAFALMSALFIDPAQQRFKQGIDDNAAQNAGNRVTPRDAVGKGAMLTEPIDL